MDAVIWNILHNEFCSFKVNSLTQQFCQNKYNLTGLCNRNSCPLANSRYATIREVNGKVYLYMKTVERMHLPSQLWQRIKLSEQLSSACKEIDKRLEFWPDFVKQKCKHRLVRIRQYLGRVRKMEKRKEMYIVESKKTKRRESNREAKALVAAKLENTIEKELMERLQSGVYNDVILNSNEKIWQRVLEQQQEPEVEEVEEELEEFEMVETDFEASDDDMEDDPFAAPKSIKKTREIELEFEDTTEELVQ
eukprot:NODE_111_length_18624_cov_1.285020.p7 type:complete len:250 gc:universal NODE_111_length_18624_cov_1.285020:1665-2414(+)